MVDGKVHRFPEPFVRLELGGERSDWTPRATLDDALSAVFALEPLCEPLLFDIQLGMARGEERRESNHELRVAHPAVEGYGPAWYDEEIVEVSRISREAVGEIVRRVLDEADRAGELLGWYSIAVRVARARLPEAARPPGRDHLVLSSEIGELEVPIEDGDVARVTSTIDDAGSPMTIRVEGEEYYITLKLRLRWSLWTDPDAPGHELVERAVASLEARGWEREER